MKQVLMFSLPTGLTDVISLHFYELPEKDKKHLWCQYFMFWCENQSLGSRLGGHVLPAPAADFHILESYVTGSRARATTVPLLQSYWTSLTVLIDDTELPLNHTNSDDTRLFWHFFFTIYFRKFIMSTNSYMNKMIFLEH